MCWRLVLADPPRASWTEVTTTMSIDDVDLANQILDAFEDREG